MARVLGQPSSGSTIPDDVQTSTAATHLKPSVDEGYDTEPTGSHATPENSQDDSNEPEQGLEIVGKGIKELIDAINQLEQLGVENLKIPLPKIVVVGDQSAGKSSLVEAISEIKVPRASGTCTRCPLQINLTADDEWVCQITLQKRYDYCGHLEQDEFEEHGLIGLYPWSLKHAPEEIPFKQIREKDQLEDMLKRAQKAVLNPGDDASLYLRERIPNNKRKNAEASFSPNIVKLDIKGPRLPNLSFYDLPGVINQTEISEEKYFVKFLKEMVKDYVKQEHTLVLLACSMEGDVANSSASKLVRKLGADRRCIGVLTKPDRLPDGGPEHLKIWKSILQGTTFELCHNYFVSKQPSQRDLDEGVTHAEARQMEADYFEKIEPWKTTFAKFSNRFGTRNLQEKLSQLLIDQILVNLPRIDSQVQSKITEIERELSTMPEPPSHESIRIVMDILINCGNAIRSHMIGEYPHNEFQQGWRQEVERFQNALFDMRPALILKSREEIEAYKRRRDDHQANHETRSSPAAGTQRSTMTPIEVDDTQPVTPNKRRATDASPSQSQSPTKKARTARPRPRSGKRQSPSLGNLYTYRHSTELAQHFMLDDVRRMIRETTTSGVPDQVDPKAVDRLITVTTQHWDKPAIEFVKQTERALRESIHAQLSENLKCYPGTKLDIDTHRYANQFLDIQFQKVYEHVDLLIRLEKAKAVTFNDRFLSICRLEELKLLKDKREETRQMLAVAEEGFEKKKNKSIELSPDPWEQEIEVMSRVRGYYAIAAARLVDSIAQLMSVQLFEECKDKLRSHFLQALGIHSNNSMEVCQQLLAEDAEREARRAQLKQELQRLRKAKEKLDTLYIVPEESIV